MNDDHQEAERLAALRSYALLDTPADQKLDDLTALVAHICETPIAMISLVDEHRQWFKAQVGLEFRETPRELSFCAHSIRARELMVVPDATQDERFARNQLVTGEPHIRFYAAAPLVTPEGAALGTLCVIDRQPRTLQPAQAEALRVLSRLVMTQFDLHRRSRELQASEAKLRAILEAEPEGVHLLDAAGVLQDTNAAGWRLIEADGPGTGAGLNLVALIAPEHREAMRTLLGAVARGESRTIEIQFTGLRGATRWIEWSAAPFHEEATGRNLVVVVTRDITDRRADEERRQRVERALRVSDAALHAISQGVLITGPDELTLASNQAFTKITGYSLEEIRGRNCRFLQGPLTDRATVKEIRRCLNSGAEFSGEILNYRQDGTPFWNEMTISPVRDEEGQLTHYIGVTRDISGRKRAEAERLAGEAKFHAIIEVSPIPMALNNDEQQITYLNPAFLETFGYRREDIPTLAEWWPKAYPDPAYRQRVADSWQAELQRSKAGGERFSPLELEVRCKDGTSKTVLVSAASISEAYAGEHLVLLYDITERKLAEQTLREREQRLSFLLTHTPMSIYTSRVSGDFGATFVSENIQALTGHPASEFVADSEFWLRHLHPDDTERVLSGIPRVFEQEKYEHEYWFRHADGTYRWMHDQVRVLRDESGQPTELIGCLIDITVDKRTALALAESEQRLRTLIDTIPQQVWTARPDGALDDVSQRVTDFFGVSAGDLLEAGWTRFVHPDDLPQCIERWTRSLATGESYAVEFRLKRASDASYRWHLGRAVALRDEAGAITKWLGTNTDISERREAEEKIRLSEERQELALAAGALGLWDWDVPSGRVLFDERWCEMLGYEVSEVEPRVESWRSLLHPDDRPDAERALARHLAGDTAVYEAEFRLRHKSSQWAWILSRGKVVERDATGAAVRVTGTHMNLTERKQLEQQFLRSQRMESIGTLAGGIAHDLNNMLSPIMMSLSVLEMRFTDPASTELLSIISDSARKGAEMVSQILSFARGVEGRRVEVQLRHLIREVEKLTSETFLKKIQVRKIVPHNLWTVIGDPTQLHQVLLNLCVNARDAMPAGGTLTLSAENVTLDEHFAGLSLEANPGAYVLLQVEDTGTGIPASVIEKIFDPFFTTKEVGKGTGLGLATTLTIIKSHGGFVRVESEPGRGAKFSIYLPAETESGLEAAAETEAEMPRGQGELILVVDDEASVRRITEQTLQLFGYRVVLAADGTEAVATYSRQRDEIAAVITDLNMPVMDGFATIQVLRRLNPQLPIIATTGLAVESQLSRVADLGVEHFLRKPCTAEALLKALRDVLDTASPQK